MNKSLMALDVDAENQLHHRQMADHESARLLKDKQGEGFRLGQFHDDLIKNGILPVSVVEWILLDDPSPVQNAIK